MSIILDMDMPSKCADCPIETDNGGMVYSCCFTGLETEYVRSNERLSDCPLKPVDDDFDKSQKF